MTELINHWKVCPIMSRARIDVQIPYIGLVYCNQGFIQVELDNDENYPNRNRPKVKCQAWSETEGCLLCKNNSHVSINSNY